MLGFVAAGLGITLLSASVQQFQRPGWFIVHYSRPLQKLLAFFGDVTTRQLYYKLLLK